ncbi:MAG TPA: AAA family ATPase [Leucothrix mucor]|nr:AAA family ATPase [Leucothrix mucor]
MKKIPTSPFTLPAVGTWGETQHQFEQESIDALETAYLAGRPLLIRGETGSGKSQLARAVAHVWERLFLSEVVNSRSESQDLHYRFDAVARLADAQAANVLLDADDKKDKDKVKAYLNPLKYLTPGILWWVFDWQSASEVYQTEGHKGKAKKKPRLCNTKDEEKTWQASDGAVILIDEIDKAETDLPNDLLETLGNGAFNVPWIDESICMQAQNPPLVIITTNDERELPAAFVRRCVVLDLNPPKYNEDNNDLLAWLCGRGEVHFAKKCSDETRQNAASLLIKNRNKAEEKGVSPAGQAEYLDLLRVLCKHTENEKDDDKRDKRHRELIEIISPYVYQKYPEMKE